MAVFKKNGAWWVDYYYLGRRYRQRIGSRRRDAEEAESRIRVRISAGDFVPPDERRRQQAHERQPMLFEDFARQDYLAWSEANHSRNHHRLQESIVRVHLIPYLQGRHLHEITSKLLDDYTAQRRRGRYRKGRRTRPVKEGTVNRDIACLKLLFKKAKEWGLLDESPAQDVRMLKEIPNPPRLLEQSEVANLLAATPDHLHALVAVAVYGGLRREELFHLRWQDIDWQNGELHVVSREDHPTKNYESRRIPMNDALQEALRRHPRRLGSVYVFANTKGVPYDNVRKSLARAAGRAAIQGGVKLHQLRHAFCSHALMQGIDPRTVQLWMGHKSLTTTLKYAHVSPDHEKAAIQRLRYENGPQVDTGAQAV